jgi:hypothetical protein
MQLDALDILYHHVKMHVWVLLMHAMLFEGKTENEEMYCLQPQVTDRNGGSLAMHVAAVVTSHRSFGTLVICSMLKIHVPSYLSVSQLGAQRQVSQLALHFSHPASHCMPCTNVSLAVKFLCFCPISAHPARKAYGKAAP